MATRICAVCGFERDEEEFPIHGRFTEKRGRKACCVHCDRRLKLEDPKRGKNPLSKTYPPERRPPHHIGKGVLIVDRTTNEITLCQPMSRVPIDNETKTRHLMAFYKGRGFTVVDITKK